MSREPRSPADTALRLLHEEHRTLEAMLLTIPMLLARHRDVGQPPPVALLRQMLCYIAEYPERRHHPKEDALLFPALRSARPDLGPVLDRLAEEHRQGDLRLGRLERALTAWEVLGEGRRAGFERELGDYVAFYLGHMKAEETQVLPATRAALTTAQWEDLAQALRQTRDPLVASAPAAPDEFRALHDAILGALPEPLGYGGGA